MRVVLTGSTGFIGSRLTASLREAGHECTALARTGSGANTKWSSIEGADAVVHLAGEPVAQRWTEDVKKRIRESRRDGTANLVRALGQLSRRPSVLVNASAIGIYGDRGDETLTEASPAGSGFLADVTREWEAAADGATALGMRVVKIRIGVVLGKNGGALAKMLPVFRAGLGGKLGSGRQWMSWVHLDDLAGLFRFALENDAVSGVLNGTAPNPVRNAEFTRDLAGVLHRPALFTVPGAALRLMFGEMATAVLGGQRVLPAATEGAGFRFRYPELRPALEDILGR